MSFPLGKLLELSVVKDRIVMSRVGGVQFLPDHGTVTMQEGEAWDLEDMDLFLPFTDAHGDVVLS